MPIYNIPPRSTGPVPSLPPGIERKGWWYSTPTGGRCNGTSISKQESSCTWSRDPFVRIVWEEDLVATGYDFSPIGCAVWVCLPDAAAQASQMIDNNAIALRKAVDALPLPS
eukprot:m.47004 g.47004  ORF g.47004 m.47004 type:complete len:112 (-) comp10436_c0_seq1:93-428(-)